MLADYVLSVQSACTDECQDAWERPQAGRYQKVRWLGRNIDAHRLACLLAHGDPPAGMPEAAHACGNSKCVNPRHLRWASRQSNEDDKTRHRTRPRGTRHHSSRLSEDDVGSLRSAYASGATTTELAERYGISRSSAYAAAIGRTWRHVTGGPGDPSRQRASSC